MDDGATMEEHLKKNRRCPVPNVLNGGRVMDVGDDTVVPAQSGEHTKIMKIAVSASAPASVKDIVENVINLHPVVIFGKVYCPHCKKAKEAINEAGTKVAAFFEAKVIEMNLMDDGAEVQAYLEEKTGRRSVPNVFIGGEAVGGSDEIVGYMTSGVLPQMITAAVSMYRPDSFSAIAYAAEAGMGVASISNGCAVNGYQRYLKKGGERHNDSEKAASTLQLTPLLLYYVPCLVAGEALGYRARLVREVLTLDLIQLRTATVMAFLLSCAVTVVANLVYSRDVKRFGRKVQWASVALFSLSNGIGESFAFFASFDLGEWLIMLITNGRVARWLALCSGFFTFSIFSGLIHSYFWLPCLPVHMRPKEERGPPVFLVGFLLMSVCWLALWKLFDSSLAFVCLHVLADVFMSYLIALRLT